MVQRSTILSLLQYFERGKPMEYTFTVTGMTCGHCERAVVHAVRSIDEDALIKVDLPTGQVVVQSDKARDLIATAIREEGYQVAA